MKRSDSIQKLVDALAKAQSEFTTVAKDSENPAFRAKYADMSSVIAATRPALTKHGLVVIQTVSSDFDLRCVIVETTLAHASGEWIAETMHMPSEDWKAQKLGSAITYGRRYTYQGIVGIAPEDDDDGNAASAKQEPRRVEAARSRTPAAPEKISDEQRKAFWAAVKDSGRDKQAGSSYLSGIGFSDSSLVTNDRYADAMAWAQTPPVESAPQEKQARQAAELLDLTEAELMTHVGKAKGDWNLVYQRLSDEIEARDAKEVA